ENSKDLHPYESKIKALLEKPQLDVKFSNGRTGDMKDAYVWVHDEEKLKQLVEVLSNERVFAVDTEQHSLHSFLGFTALIQISTRDEDYLVDTIALHDVMGILGPVFANPNICKVFRGADNDVIWLQRDFHIYVVNLFDTVKVRHVTCYQSLAYLLETYYGVITNKFYQEFNSSFSLLSLLSNKILMTVASTVTHDTVTSTFILSFSSIDPSGESSFKITDLSAWAHQLMIGYHWGAENRKNQINRKQLNRTNNRTEFPDMEKSGCKEIDLTSLADTFNLQAKRLDPTNQSVREYVRAAEHSVWQQREEYIGNGEKAADVNRDEDGSCLAGGAIRIFRTKRHQIIGYMLNMAGVRFKQMVLKTRCDMDADIVPLHSVEHRGPVNQMVLKTRCDMDGGIVPLRSVEHGGPIKRLVIKTRCDMDGGIVPLRSVLNRRAYISGGFKELAVIWNGGISLALKLSPWGPIKRLVVLKRRCDMDCALSPCAFSEHGWPNKALVKNPLVI
ncbi:RRP6-like protein 3 isoform X1, partial [Tanacetum coccineum]